MSEKLKGILDLLNQLSQIQSEQKGTGETAIANVLHCSPTLIKTISDSTDATARHIHEELNHSIESVRMILGTENNSQNKNNNSNNSNNNKTTDHKTQDKNNHTSAHHEDGRTNNGKNSDGTKADNHKKDDHDGRVNNERNFHGKNHGDTTKH